MKWKSARSNSDMDYHGIFNVRTDVNACDCTQGCTDTLRESALKLTLWEKSLSMPGNWTCHSGMPVQCSTNLATATPCYIWNQLLTAHVCFAISGNFALFKVVYQLGLKNCFAVSHIVISDFAISTKFLVTQRRILARTENSLCYIQHLIASDFVISGFDCTLFYPSGNLLVLLNFIH